MLVDDRSNLGHSATFVDRCFGYSNVAVKGSKRNVFDMKKVLRANMHIWNDPLNKAKYTVFILSLIHI